MAEYTTISDAEAKARGLDMIRHIAASQGITKQEIATIFGIQAIPSLSDALNNLFTVKVGVNDTGHVEDATEDTAPVPKDAAALRAEMQGVIDLARTRFEDSHTNAPAFNPECFSTLMMAYRYAIETQDCGEG